MTAKEFFDTLIHTWWGILIIVIVVLAVWLLLSVLLYRQFFKRFYDILLSGLALLILSPVYIVLSILVRAKLGKPVIFKQLRPGKKCRVFKLHKYRTMTDERDEGGELLPDGERLTKFGKTLRSTSLDELPEIWNIFTGKMSIVGPRPQLIKDLVFMDEETKLLRHKVRPGLTGLAQISGRNNIDWDKRLEYDLKYVKKISFFGDIKIFFKTIFKVFKKSDIDTDGLDTSEDYGDYLLRTGRITKEHYDEMIEEVNGIKGKF